MSADPICYTYFLTPEFGSSVCCHRYFNCWSRQLIYCFRVPGSCSCTMAVCSFSRPGVLFVVPWMLFVLPSVLYVVQVYIFCKQGTVYCANGAVCWPGTWLLCPGCCLLSPRPRSLWPWCCLLLSENNFLLLSGHCLLCPSSIVCCALGTVYCSGVLFFLSWRCYYAHGRCWLLWQAVVCCAQVSVFFFAQGAVVVPGPGFHVVCPHCSLLCPMFCLEACLFNPVSCLCLWCPRCCLLCPSAIQVDRIKIMCIIVKRRVLERALLSFSVSGMIVFTTHIR